MIQEEEEGAGARPSAPLAVGGVGQAKLQYKHNWPWYYAVIFLYHSRAIDDYPGLVAQRSVCQGSQDSYAARVP